MKRQSNATKIVIGIIIILAIVLGIQQYSIRQHTREIKSVREESMMQESGVNNGDVDATGAIELPTITENELTGVILTGLVSTGAFTTGSITGSTVNSIVAGNAECVTSYQALIDRAYGSSVTNDVGQGLSQNVGLTYCSGATPSESDFLTIQSNGQSISYSDLSGGSLELDGTSISPNFTQNCEGSCPQVQAIRLARNDNRYVVLETTQPRDYQSSFRLVSTTNGVTMLFWSVLNYVDPVVSYAWSSSDHFVFISTSGRETRTYVVQPRGFPNATAIDGETDTPIAVTVDGDSIVVLYDRDVTNTSTGDRYSKSYNFSDIQSSVTSGSNATL